MREPGYPLVSFQLIRSKRSIQAVRHGRFHLISFLHPGQLGIIVGIHAYRQFTHAQHFGQFAHLILGNLHIGSHAQALQRSQLPFQGFANADIFIFAYQDELAFIVCKIGLQNLFKGDCRVP